MFEHRPGDVAAVRLWAFHHGIYNALLALTAIAAAVTLILGATIVGATLTLTAGLSMIIAAVALIAADPRPKRLSGLLAQAVPPVASLLLLVVSALV